MTLRGAAQVAAAHCPNERTLDQIKPVYGVQLINVRYFAYFRSQIREPVVTGI